MALRHIWLVPLLWFAFFVSPAAEPAVLKPGENLVAQDIPAIPAALAAEVRRYTESRAATLADWLPPGREMLISTRFANTAQVHRLRMPGGARIQLTFFDEPVGAVSVEPGRGRCFVFARDNGGDEYSQLYRYDLADGRVTRLSDGGRSQNGGVVWSRRGERIAFASTRRNGVDRDIWVMDPQDPGSAKMVMQASGGGWNALQWSPGDDRLLLGEYLSVTDSRLWLLDPVSGARTLLTPPVTGGAAYGRARFAADGRSLFLTSDRGSEFMRLCRLDLTNRRLEPLIADIPWDVEDLDLSPDGRLLTFVCNEAGVSRLYLYDVAAGRRRPVDAVPEGVISGLAFHPSQAELGFSLQTARTPADVFSYDVASGTLRRWTESELGGLNGADLAVPQLVSWNSFDGRAIGGFLYRPPARFPGRRPVIVNIHGGPEGQARPTFLGRNNYFLNELGVAVLYPNVRGSIGFGKTFVTLDNGMKREDSVRDIGALLDWIAAQPDLDPDRVMVTGGSYGGYMALAVATLYNERIRCALDVVGISHFATFLQNTESYRRDLRRVEYGDERDPTMRAFFERIAPLNRAASIRKPLFIVQGGNDPRVPRTEAVQMAERVRAGGTPVWYLEARDEGHGFRKKNNADFQFYATVLFVRQFLLAAPVA